MSIRTERVSAEIQRNIAEILMDGLPETKFTGLITVTSVNVSADLSHATIRISILSKDEQTSQEDFAKIETAKPYIRKCLSYRMKNMRITPELHFELDQSIAYASKIDAILNKLNKE